MDFDADPDESSSPETLDQFRKKWQNELKTSKKNELNQSSAPKCESIDEQADRLFTQAVELEKQGKVFEAMRMYRRAVHLDRDIEFKMYEKLKASTQPTNIDEILVGATENMNLDDDVEDLEGVDLLARFQQSIVNDNGRLFESNTEKGVITTESLHISNLPIEIILHILRWVVSSHLDLRSLEQCSMVCKGFYICARDDDIWRLACKKIWGGLNLLDATKFRTWRQMFIERPRVCFNGCYISKTSYLRYGERNFQDQSYRPVHLVEYYRYIRFFPDRTVIVTTSADEPSNIVAKMQRNNFMKGNYKFNDDVVTIIVRKNSSKQQHQNDRMHGLDEYDTKTPTFCMQLQMSYTKKRRTPQLEWKKYSIIQRKNKYEELCTDFELKPKLYPPLMFSRVKSYNAVAHRQL